MHSSSNYHYQPGRLHSNRIVKYSRPQQTDLPTTAYAAGQVMWSSCPIAESVTRSVPESVTKSVTKSVTESVLKSVPEPVTDTVVGPAVGGWIEHKLLRQTALAEAKDGNYVDAIALFDELLDQNPLNASDYNNRGLAHFKCHHHDQALADYNMAIALDATLDSVYNNRANYYAHHGDLLGALLDYDTAIDLNPYNVRAWINQGITFRDLKMYSRAVECFDAALNFGVLQDHIYLERGRAYHLRGDWNCAIADYQRVINDVVEVCDQLGEREIQLLDQAEDGLDDLLAPLARF
ncbi:MAG: tetratricopeptide repeat protein [Leptolyngbyaceae cyanobacterium]